MSETEKLIEKVRGKLDSAPFEARLIYSGNDLEAADVRALCAALQRLQGERDEARAARDLNGVAAAQLKLDLQSAESRILSLSASHEEQWLTREAAEAQSLAWQRRSEQFEENERRALARNDDLWVQVEAMRKALVDLNAALDAYWNIGPRERGTGGAIKAIEAAQQASLTALASLTPERRVAALSDLAAQDAEEIWPTVKAEESSQQPRPTSLEGELLAALRDAHDTLTVHFRHEAPAVIEAARIAIAKADGRSQWRCRSCGSAFASAGGKIVGGACPTGRPTCPLEPV